METELARTIGETARAARRALDLTQEEAAERVGISMVFYARIERGETLPSTPTLAALSRSLNVSADALLGRTKVGGPLGAASLSRKGEPAASPDVRRLLRRLRGAKPRTIRLFCQLAADLKK